MPPREEIEHHHACVICGEAYAECSDSDCAPYIVGVLREYGFCGDASDRDGECLRNQRECHACGFKDPPGGLKPYRMDRYVPKEKYKILCHLCASTFAGNALEYPDQYPHSESVTLFAVCYVGNKILKALGAKTETEKNNMITTLKGFTDKKLQRHYYPEHEEWEVSECSNQIKFDMAGQAEIFIDRDEAADLAKLFADFAKHGTFRVPRNQEPSKTSNGEITLDGRER